MNKKQELKTTSVKTVYCPLCRTKPKLQNFTRAFEHFQISLKCNKCKIQISSSGLFYDYFLKKVNKNEQKD